MKKILPLIGTLLLVGAGCFSNTAPPPTDIATSTPTSTPETTTTTLNNPEAQANITVASPTQKQAVNSPVTITGQARVFENVVNWDIRDANGNLLASGHATAQAPDAGQYGFYSIITSYPTPATTSGVIRVFDYSAKDGSMENVVAVPVSFSNASTTDASTTSTVVLAFFSNIQKDPNMAECGRTYPVQRRIAKTQAVGRAALQELLKGPSVQEKSQGYQTSINEDVAIASLTITDGVAHADFSPKLEQAVGGSCRVAAIRSQITNTLMQFPTVKSVVISIDGRTEDILQP